MQSPYQQVLLEIAIEAASGEKLATYLGTGSCQEVGKILGDIRKKATAALNGEEPPSRPGRPRKDRQPEPEQAELPGAPE